MNKSKQMSELLGEKTAIVGQARLLIDAHDSPE